MNYKNHHKALEFLYKRKKASSIKTDAENTSKSTTFVFNATCFAKELNIKDDEVALSILSDLRADNSLHAGFNQKLNETEFWISELGISKYFQKYYFFKYKEQKKENLRQFFMVLFYIISTIGIISSTIYNTYSTREIKDKIEQIEKQVMLKQTTKK